MSKLILPLGLILGSIFIILVLIVPGWQHFLMVRADTKRLQDIDVEIDSLTQKRDAIIQQINAITKDDSQRLDQVIPSDAQGPEFLLQLQKLGVARGLHVDKLDIMGVLSTNKKVSDSNEANFVPAGIEGDTQSYKTIEANMELTGPYDSFKGFLRDVESHIRITDISGITVLPTPGGGFAFKLNIKTYYQ